MHIPSTTPSRHSGRNSTCQVVAVMAACIAGLSPAHADSPRPEGVARQPIDHYHMRRIPQEGPWYSLSYSSEDLIGGAALPSRYAGPAHVAGNAIGLLET